MVFSLIVEPLASRASCKRLRQVLSSVSGSVLIIELFYPIASCRCRFYQKKQFLVLVDIPSIVAWLPPIFGLLARHLA
jgi:hypothetical protein